MCLIARSFAAAILLGQVVVMAQSNPFVRASLTIPAADLFLVATDPNGDVYVAGRTNDPAFRATTGAAQAQLGGGNDVVIAKIRSSDGRLIAATLLGGAGEDSPTTLVIDRAGWVHVAGTTTSRNFPAPEGAFQRTTRSASTSFVSKLNSSLTAIEYSTYLGGAGSDRISGLAVDLQGSVYVTGVAESRDFPTTEGVYQRTHSPGIVFVSRLNANGSGLIASTFLAPGSAPNIAVDSQGSVLVAGTTNNDRFPVTADAVQPTLRRTPPFTYSDAFVTRLAPDLKTLRYSTFFGGTQNDAVSDLDVDSDGNVYIAGTSFSRDFPLTITDATIGDAGTAFVAKLASGRVIYARALRGNSSTTATGIEPGRDGAVHVTGFSTGTHYPTTGGAYRRCLPATQTSSPVPFYTRLDRDGGYTYSTLMPDPVNESRQWLTALPSGEIYVLALRPAIGGSPFVGSAPAINELQRIDPAGTPAARVDCVVNAANYAPSSVSPGLVVTVFTSAAGPASGVAGGVENGVVTTTAGGVRVLFDGVPAPILFARQDQVNAIVPFSLADRTTTQMTIEYNGAPTGPVILPVRPTHPGIFRLGTTEQAVILNEDGTVNSIDNAAARGSFITFWITGFGQYETAARDGEIMGHNLSRMRLPVTVRLQDQQAEILYAGSAPGMVAGVAQVNVRVPLTAPASVRVPITLGIGSDVSQNTAYVSLK